MLKILRVANEDDTYSYIVYSFDTNSQIAKFSTYAEAKAFLG